MHKMKYLLFAGLSVLLSLPVFAQESAPQSAQTPPPGANSASAPQWSNRDMTYRGKNYDPFDSSYYPKFRSKQFHKYMDHQEIFPPKPRNQWEIGGGLGLFTVVGNVPSLVPTIGLNLGVRKSLGYIFSLRAQYIYGVAKNLDRQATTGYDAPYTKFGYTPGFYNNGTPANAVYRATRTEASQVSLDLMLNAYNINFHHARNSMSFFGYFGLGGFAYKTRINALDGSYLPYDFSTIVKDPNEKASKVRKDLKSGMDKTFESAAPTTGGAHILDGKKLDFAPSIGAGVQYKINKKFNVQLEERYTFPSNDPYIDGSPFGASLGGSPAKGRSSDAINYLSLTINYNLKTKKKSVEPLYWINPLDHAYSELSYPRHMVLPNPVLPDEDGDGITDQFDKCPKTPAGVAVDSHGCPLDTDGDGVPDYKDKQLITPTECQPVDADGVGKCPCPDACKDMGTNKTACGSIGAGTLLFTAGSHISTGMEAQLATLAAQMQANPNCKAVILGGGSGSKIKEQHSWEHVNAVIEYMGEKNNIARQRFIFKYGEAGDENIVTYRSANEEESKSGANDNPPPPHPEIK